MLFRHIGKLFTLREEFTEVHANAILDGGTLVAQRQQNRLGLELNTRKFSMMLASEGFTACLRIEVAAWTPRATSRC